MAIILNKLTKFKLVYFNEKFEECSELFDTKIQAEKRKKEITKQFKNPIKINESTTVADYIYQYVDTVISSKSSHTTYKAKRSLIYSYIRDYTNDLFISEVNQDDCSDIIKRIEKATVNHLSTKKKGPYVSYEVFFKCYRLLLEAFQYLYVNEIIDDNYFANIEVKRIKNRKKDTTEWTITLFEEMMDNCNDSDLFVFLHLIFNTKLSIKEIRALEMSNIVISDEFLNRECCYIESSNILERVNKDVIKHIKSNVIEIFTPKQSNSTKTKLVLYKNPEPKRVMLPNSLAKLLLEYIDIVRYIHHQNNSKYNFLFSNNKGEPIDYRTLQKKYDLIKPNKNLSFLSLSKFGAMNTKYSMGEIYYYQLNEDLKLPNNEYKKRNSQIKRITCEKNINDFMKEVENSLPSEEDVNISAFIDFLNKHDEFKIQLLHKLKEVI